MDVIDFSKDKRKVTKKKPTEGKTEEKKPTNGTY